MDWRGRPCQSKFRLAWQPLRLPLCLQRQQASPHAQAQQCAGHMHSCQRTEVVKLPSPLQPCLKAFSSLPSFLWPIPPHPAFRQCPQTPRQLEGLRPLGVVWHGGCHGFPFCLFCFFGPSALTRYGRPTINQVQYMFHNDRERQNT
jgi:hypothetical protein